MSISLFTLLDAGFDDNLRTLLDTERKGAKITVDFGNIQFLTFDNQTFDKLTRMPVTHAEVANVYAHQRGDVTFLFAYPATVFTNKDVIEFATIPQMFLLGATNKGINSLRFRAKQKDDLLSILVAEKIIPRSLQVEYNKLIRAKNKREGDRYLADQLMRAHNEVDEPLSKALQNKVKRMGITQEELDGFNQRLAIRKTNEAIEKQSKG